MFTHDEVVGDSPPGKIFEESFIISFNFRNMADPTVLGSKPSKNPSAKAFPTEIPPTTTDEVSALSIPRMARIPPFKALPNPWPILSAASTQNACPLLFHHSANGVAITSLHNILILPPRSAFLNSFEFTVSDILLKVLLVHPITDLEMAAAFFSTVSPISLIRSLFSFRHFRKSCNIGVIPVAKPEPMRFVKVLLTNDLTPKSKLPRLSDIFSIMPLYCSNSFVACFHLVSMSPGALANSSNLALASPDIAPISCNLAVASPIEL